MDWTDGRIVVMHPNAVAAATVVERSHAPQVKQSTGLVAGHDSFLFVARGEGRYRINGNEGRLQPNTLIAAPAGTIACTLSDDRELYVISVRDAGVTPDDQSGFIPFFERRLSAADGRLWHERMQTAATRTALGQFDDADVSDLKNAALPYIWKHDSHAAQTTLHALFATIWDRLATPLSMETLAAEVGYTANYLNDLTRAHTGRALGRWIADMRMARARVGLEQTDAPIAVVGLSCGYDDPAYFSRAFRRAHGVPPQAWRLAARPVDPRHARVALPIEVVHQVELDRHFPERSYSFAS